MFHGLSIKEYIKEHKDSDTEYWYLVGAYPILSRLLNYSEKDWDWLNNEILNWPEEEIEILAIAIAHFDSYPQETDRIIEERFNLFSHIFMSVELHISYDLLDELLNFLELTDLNLEINSLRKIQTQFDKLKSMFNEENSIKWFSEIQSKINDKMRTANLKES